ncbi:MAG: hypothetical protein KC415_14790 [Anaerolineales bacterium]|nr:hypothetical protein [Anaerolineales bacterium]MCB8991424.1 hypothetical protein [Ardenticatenaceae bacterium]MCB9003956.1 hypothetical protein [Ardenticatenaceae bacterium]
MCGIAAVLLNPHERTPETWEALRQSFTSNLLFNEKRGQAATGVAVMDVHGHLEMYKQPLPAAEFVGTERYRALLAGIGSETTLILGHTRFPTKGSPDNDANNHPICIGPVCGVHNGRIQNDDALFAQTQLPRRAEVDSEIIFQLLAQQSVHSNPSHYLTAIRPVMQQMRGQFTFLAADVRSPQRLLVVKHQNPLSVHYHAQWQALVFSSRYIFLRKAFGRTVRTETLPQDQLMVFDTTLLTQSGSGPRQSLALFA